MVSSMTSLLRLSVADVRVTSRSMYPSAVDSPIFRYWRTLLESVAVIEASPSAEVFCSVAIVINCWSRVFCASI